MQLSPEQKRERVLKAIRVATNATVTRTQLYYQLHHIINSEELTEAVRELKKMGLIEQKETQSPTKAGVAYTSCPLMRNTGTSQEKGTIQPKPSNEGLKEGESWGRIATPSGSRWVKVDEEGDPIPG